MTDTTSDTDSVSSDVREVKQTATGWVHEWLAAFDPLETTPRQLVSARWKAFSELSHNLAVRATVEGIDDRLHEFLVERVNDPAYYRLLRRYPGQVARFGSPLVYADRHDELDPEPARLLRAAFDRRAVWHAEGSAYERLELLRLATLTPGVEPPESPASVVERSYLARPPHTVTASALDGYKLTHDVFFATDYGRLGPGFDRPPVKEPLRTSLLGLLAREMDREQTDLVVELLAAGVILDALPPAAVGAAAEWLQARCESDRLVGPSLSDQPDSSLSHGGVSELSGDDHLWATNYHTNTAASLLMAVVADRWDDVGEQNPSATAVADAYEALSAVGAAVNALSKYDLESGARAVREASGVSAPYAAVLEECESFIATQRRADGQFGHWWQERVAAEANYGHEVDLSGLIEQTSRECGAVLEGGR